MTRAREQAALLALLTRPEARWLTIAEAVEDIGSALEVIESVPAGQQELFNASQDIDAEIAAAAALIDSWENEGIHFVTLLDEGYPAQLLTIHQRPPFVTFRGKLNDGDARGVAVVGTRHPSKEGQSCATELAAGLAERGVAVISGLAAGIDTAALTGSLRKSGRTVAVIGTGLRQSYPRQNASLQRRIGEDGAVISQFLPDAPPTKYSFPMRNAVMSGYAAATVVVEAAWKSGARMQARLALEHGRPVFLLRSLLNHDWARDYAERPGVTVVDEADDVLARLDELMAPVEELVWS
jgi:DNA processing protein